MTAWKRRLPLALIVCALLALWAIDARTGTPATGQVPDAQASTSPAPRSTLDPIPRIAIVYDATGRGSNGYNKLAWEGAKRAADALRADLLEVTAKPGETDADREQRLVELADARYDPIFIIGASYASAVATVAPKFPHTWFGMLDDGTVNAPNVIGMQFHEEQGSFLVGAAAALTSKTGQLGFIGGVQNLALQTYEAGFTAGARAANPHVKVQVAYLSLPPGDAGFSEPAKARTAALGMYDAGADVIFGAAGGSGVGVVQAAHDRGLWAIGNNADQFLTSDPSVRGAILTSMLKQPDVATYIVAMEVGGGVPKDGNNVFGVDVGGVAYSTSGGFVDAIRAQLDGFAAKIAAGQILVPTTP